MSLKKQMLKSKPVCKVTFRVSKEMAAGADTVAVAGDFNNWSPADLPLKKLKTGEFTGMVELASGKSYEFRYVVGGRWCNEPEADGFARNSFGSENCLLAV